eukprot:CAMPEP_0197624038 /NCGR_PEP_ID=MMETSP1338-20131121/3853_1 /TAXON_ID=43686 ORGANISM="Pelagodinium beii, Strain RCC1491" /NCGR_SAMPLE_ID=MMETSP1338 /ASSEMBLY_ACC=CAM_ASM_000754 /LENGTH=443 /DNA_ID=CAMNT_0043194133 /DNA_START=80 /DNA_END=1408 /DNA_ORIENTATION=+
MGAQLCKQICNRQGESGDAMGRRVLSEMVGQTVVEKSTGRVAKLIDTDKSDIPCKLCYFDSVGQISWLREHEVFFLAAAEKYALADMVGHTVLEKSSGRLAKLITTDSSDVPCKICYFDRVGDICWCCEAELHLLSTAEEKELLAWAAEKDARQLREVATLQQSQPQARATAPSQAETIELPAINSWSDLEALFQQAQQAAHGIETTPPAQKAKAWDNVEKLWAHSLEFSECFSPAVEASHSSTEKISCGEPAQFEIPLVVATPSLQTAKKNNEFDVAANLQGEFLDSWQGHTVHVRNTGRIGKVIMHNTSGVLPYKVRFSEGDSDWFKAEDVNLVLDAGSLVKVASKGVGLIVGKKNAKGNSQFKVQLQNGSPEWCHEKCLSPVSCKCGAIPPAEGAAHEAYKMPRANASMLPVAKSQKTGAGSLKPDARHGAASVRLTGPG